MLLAADQPEPVEYGGDHVGLGVQQVVVARRADHLEAIGEAEVFDHADAPKSPASTWRRTACSPGSASSSSSSTDAVVQAGVEQPGVLVDGAVGDRDVIDEFGGNADVRESGRERRADRRAQGLVARHRQPDLGDRQLERAANARLRMRQRAVEVEQDDLSLRNRRSYHATIVPADRHESAARSALVSRRRRVSAGWAHQSGVQPARRRGDLGEDVGERLDAEAGTGRHCDVPVGVEHERRRQIALPVAVGRRRVARQGESG